MFFKLFTYEQWMKPLQYHPFFKHGTPFTYLLRTYDKDGGWKYSLCWYFNVKDDIKKHSGCRYVGDYLSIKLSYLQLIRRIKHDTIRIFKYKKQSPS